MIRPEVLAYLRENLKKFPEDTLRVQLHADGVADAEIEAALDELKKTKAEQPTKVKARASMKLARVLIFIGALALVLAGVMAFFQKPKAISSTVGLPSRAGEAGSESGFVGKYGYVVKLPAGYTAVQSFKDGSKTIEIVHFCRAGTDPTNFLDEGLFGQLGIVRLTVQPNPVSDDLHGLENLTAMVTGRAQSRGEKFTVKNLQISSLRGLQLIYDVPYPRVESFILGHDVLYSFTAGQDDEYYRTLLQSLRDARSET